jgi:hypothetical protein
MLLQEAILNRMCMKQQIILFNNIYMAGLLQCLSTVIISKLCSRCPAQPFVILSGEAARSGPQSAFPSHRHLKPPELKSSFADVHWWWGVGHFHLMLNGGRLVAGNCHLERYRLDW